MSGLTVKKVFQFKVFQFVAAATAVLFAAGAAEAQSIGAFNSAGFSYGTLSGGGFTSYTPYAAGASQCLGLNGCYVGTDTYAIIAPSGNAGELLAHPGPGFGGNSAIAFSASTLGSYNLSAIGTSYDVGNKTVGYFTIINNILTTFNAGSVSGGNPQQNVPGTSKAITDTVVLNAGDKLGVFVSNINGDYTGDTTHFSGSISAVPEPATWAMMMLGFGMVGFGLRRRAKQTVRVTYA